MPRHQTWIIALVAPVLTCLALLFTCQYVSASLSEPTSTQKNSTLLPWEDSSRPLKTWLRLDSAKWFGAFLGEDRSYDRPRKSLLSSLPTIKSQNQAEHLHASSIITAPFDVLLQHSVFPTDSVYPGGRVAYTLRISHTGINSVYGLILTSTVPSEFIPTNSLNVGANITPLSGFPTYTWQIDNLKQGEDAIIYIVGNMDPTHSSAGVLTNVATLSADADSDPTNNKMAISLPIMVPKINLSSSTLNVNEDAPPVAIDIGLDTPNPYGPAKVDYSTVSLDNGTDATSGRDYVPISGTITISAANSGQRFFVDIIDDEIDEDLENIAIRLANPRGIELGSSDALTITIIDDDDADVFIDPLQLEVSEDGQTEKYAFTLTSQPVAEVYITLDEGNDLVVDSSVITFTAANWSIPQHVTVGAAVNEVADGDRSTVVIHQINSQDPFYHNQNISKVAVRISDDDSTGIIISTSEITISEGSDTAINNDVTYTIVLNSMPTAAVSIAVNSDSEQLRTDKESVTFTPQNWFNPQTITISATDDAIAEGTQTTAIEHNVSSADAKYESTEAADVLISIEDNDYPDIIFSTNMVTTTEDIFDGTYHVTLASEPRSLVELQTKTENSRLLIEPDIIRFSPTTWSIPQQITVSASTDHSIIGTQTITVEHVLQSQDPMYNDRTESLAVSVRDIDQAGLGIGSDTLTILEGTPSSDQQSIAALNQYDVFLSSRPVNTVTVSLDYSEQLTVVPNILIFEPDEWAKTKSVKVSVNDDSTFYGRQAFTITHRLASSDLNYDALTESLQIVVIDDDSPVVGSGDGGLVVGTSSDDYTIALAKQPTGTVTIALTTNDQILVEPSAVQFTDTDWNNPQTITVTSTDDELQDDKLGIVSYKILSTDQSYAQTNEMNLFEIPIVDNDQNTSLYLPIIDVLQ